MSKNIRILTIIALAVATIFAIVPARAQTAVQLNLLGWSATDAENANLNKILDQFNTANSGKYQAKFTASADFDTDLAKALASGNPPDVFYVDSSKIQDLVKAGAVKAIGDKLTNASDFYPSLKDAFTVNGTFYCPPKDFSTLALELNMDMLNAAGVKPPTTWDELAAAAKALTTSDHVGIIFDADPARWGAFLYQAGGSFTDDKFSKMTINSPEGLSALKFYQSLHDAGYAKTAKEANAGWAGEAFEKGAAAMAMEGNWIMPDLKNKAPNMKVQVVELPAGKTKATLAFTVCYAVAANGKNQDAALALVNYLTGPDGMKAWTDLGLAMPTRASLSDAWGKKYPEQAAFLAGAAYAHKWSFVPGFSAVTDEIGTQIKNVFDGSITPEDALAKIEKDGNTVLQAAMSAATPAATAAK